MGRLDSVFLSKVNLPSFDKYNFFHPANFRSNFSKIGFQIEGDLWGAPNGIPRYVIGKAPTLQPKISAKACTLFTSPIGTISLLATLIFKLVTAWKQSSSSRTCRTCSTFASQNKIVSSANNKWETHSPLPSYHPPWSH